MKRRVARRAYRRVTAKLGIKAGLNFARGQAFQPLMPWSLRKTEKTKNIYFFFAWHFERNHVVILILIVTSLGIDIIYNPGSANVDKSRQISRRAIRTLSLAGTKEGRRRPACPSSERASLPAQRPVQVAAIHTNAMTTASALAEISAAEASTSSKDGSPFPMPEPNASLMLSFRPRQKKMLIVGAKRLAASRVFASLEADMYPVVVGVGACHDAVDGKDYNNDLSGACDEVRWRVQAGQAQWRSGSSTDDETWWNFLLDEVDEANHGLFAVCVTDTLNAGDDDECCHTEVSRGRSASNEKSSFPLSPLKRAKMLVSLCRARRIPINVADQPLLCDFSFPATHRFASTATAQLKARRKSAGTSLQIAVTTNGKGCRLAGRIRRDIVTSLPKNVGDAVEKVGQMREMAKQNNFGGGHGPLTSSEACTDKTWTQSRPVLLHRRRAQKESGGIEGLKEDDLSFDSTPLNSPVPQLTSGKTDGSFFDKVADQLCGQQEQEEATSEEVLLAENQELTRRRMRWVAQMSEYWPIEYLGRLSEGEMSRALNTYNDEDRQFLESSSLPASLAERDKTPRGRNRTPAIIQSDSNDIVTDSSKSESGIAIHGKLQGRSGSQHALRLSQPSASGRDSRGHIFLLGSGPGHPGLLTILARDLLTSKDTDLVLSDKLVPSSILSLIPSETPLIIARKFPGNAEGAQSELIDLALRAARDEGKRVVRLKQGDPFVYGRGGEEVLAFVKQGVSHTVVPGISSALAAPLMVGIPVTQRGAADSMTLCTGVGRGGKSVRLPGYERGRTLVVLMGVARLKDVVATLVDGWHDQTLRESQGRQQQVVGTRLGQPFPPYTPIAIIERASSADQRLVASTLEFIEEALMRCGEQRPPGMMVIGWAVMSLEGAQGNVDILDDEAACEEDEAALEQRDRARIERWLGSEKDFLVREGLDHEFSNFTAKTSAPATNSELLHAIPSVDAVLQRSSSGWAPPRYGSKGPHGD